MKEIDEGDEEKRWVLLEMTEPTKLRREGERESVSYVCVVLSSNCLNGKKIKREIKSGRKWRE